MRGWHLSAMVDVVDGRLSAGDAVINGISTDTRTLNEGALFVALTGPNFDGHAFVDAAAAKGASAALVGRAVQTSLPLLIVDDPLIAMGKLARAWRQQQSAAVVAITGSNGKTTLKEMLSAILSEEGSVLATRGNLNNAIGVPLTLSELDGERFAVVELGANHAGEIAYLTDLVRPDVAVLNNAGRAHLEGFGSLEGVAHAKAEIIQGLPADGVFVLNADDRFAPLWRQLSAGRRQRSFGIQYPADVSSPPDAYEVAWNKGAFEARFPVDCGGEAIEIGLRLAGQHNRMNALAAIAAATAVGAGLDSARTALMKLEPVSGRLRPLPARDGATLIDDSYNANPESVGAALQVLAAAPGRRTLVLGDLAELGSDAVALHRALGEQAGEVGVDRLYTCGELSAAASQAFPRESKHFSARDALIEALAPDLATDDFVLIKGSRSARMDEVVRGLQAEDAAC